jgi:hypothetical protein
VLNKFSQFSHQPEEKKEITINTKMSVIPVVGEDDWIVNQVRCSNEESKN